MISVFEESSIRTIRLRNRILRSATHEGRADEEGRPTAELILMYEKLARGGAGAIITGEAAVQPNGRSSGYRPLMAHRDDLIPAYRKVTDAVHRHGASVILQLQHAGRQTGSAAAGETPVAPSAIRDAFYSEEAPRALREREIEEIIENFILGIVRARTSGFDGAQVLAAHGYLLSSFLSAAANRRTDRWGGPLENRFRILDGIIRGARARVPDFPLIVKMNAYDCARGGMRVDEAVRIAGMLERAGCDAIEVSCGTFADGLCSVRGKSLPLDAAYAAVPKYRSFSPLKKSAFRLIAPFVIRRRRPYRNYNVAAAAKIRARVGIPVIVVGGIARLGDIEDIIARGSADYVSMSRAFVIEPDIVNGFKSGRRDESRCISCNFCSIGLMTGPLRCYRGSITTFKGGES